MADKPQLTQRAERELRQKQRAAAASELIEQFGLGKFTSAKSKRAKRKAHRPINPVFVAPTPDRNRFVYVIGAETGPVKIGIATDVAQRLASLQTGHPQKLKAYFHTATPKAAAIERACHREFEQYRLTGEWFDVSWDVAAAAIRKQVS